MNLYVNTTENALLASSSSNAQINPFFLPLFYGDTLPLQVYLFQKQTSPNQSTFHFNNIQTAGVTFALYLTNGLPNGISYTDQLIWVPGIDNTGALPLQYFAANLALNTTLLQTLCANGPKQATLQMSMQTALTPGPQTIFSQLVTIGIGVPAGALQVPAPLTPLSLQQANATFYPQQPAAGQPLYIVSKNGHTLLLEALDNADGSVTFQANQIN